MGGAGGALALGGSRGLPGHMEARAPSPTPLPHSQVARSLVEQSKAEPPILLLTCLPAFLWMPLPWQCFSKKEGKRQEAGTQLNLGGGGAASGPSLLPSPAGTVQRCLVQQAQ